MADISILLHKSGNTFDISGLVESVKWKGRKGSAARSLNVSLLDDKSGMNSAQSKIDVTQGDQLVMICKGNEIFRGLAMSQQQSESRKMPVSAYDNGIYLANNKDTFVYENKTVHDIFIDICKRFGLKYSEAVQTSHR